VRFAENLVETWRSEPTKCGLLNLNFLQRRSWWRRLIENLRKQLTRVYIHDPGNLNEFNDVYPAFAGLYTTYEGMGTLQPGG
jgi:hypothetical protein